MTSKEDVEDFCRAVTNGNWQKVMHMYKVKEDLRTVRITQAGDTALHMAASSGKELIVAELLFSLVGLSEEKVMESILTGEPNRVVGVKNEKGNTPLHLAAASASKGSYQMCKMLGALERSVITERNNSGETPLFMAALHGNKEAFLWLFYNMPDQGSSTPYINNDNDTILHCAIAGGHIDLAIEIVHLYKDHLEEMTKERNKNGLRPLHLLAATPSAFESTDPSRRSFLVQLLYHYWFFRVNNKEEATTKEELEQLECKSFFEAYKDWSMRVLLRCFSYYSERCSHLVTYIIICVIESLLGLNSLLLAPLFILEYLYLRAVNWFRGIRKLKEKHTWSLQLMEQLFQLPSGMEDVTADPYTRVNEAAGSQIVDTPLMIAAQNGVIEMVKMIHKCFRSAMTVVNEEGKNIVLLAVEKRQTKLYQFLCENKCLDDTAFRQVDNDGNTALHLAAILRLNLNMQTTTMIEEFKWFELVKNSVPREFREKYNNRGKNAEEIFRESYKELMTSDRQWLNQTSQACSVASTVVASMAFSNFAGENIDKKNYSSLVALSLSLTSTICFLAILSFRSHSRNFWKYVPFMLHLAILTMIGSIGALWISLMVHGISLTSYAILGSPIAILTIVSLPIFIGHTLMSTFTKVPPPNRSTTSAIHYRRPQEKEDGNGSLQNIGSSRGRNL